MTYARNSKPQSHTQTIKPQSQDSTALEQEQTLDVTELTFDQAVEAVDERNRRREIYGRPQSTINISFGESGQNAYARANRDPNAVLYGDLPNSFWAKALSFFEEASNDPSSYTKRRDAVLMCEALRQKLRERGF